MSASKNNKRIRRSNLLIPNGSRPIYEVSQLVGWVHRPIKCRISSNSIIRSLSAKSGLDLRPFDRARPTSTTESRDHSIIRRICRPSHRSGLDI